MPNHQPIKLDYRHFACEGKHISRHPQFEETAKKITNLQQLLLTGDDPMIKDKEVVMTGWKTESPYVADTALEEIQATAKNFASQIDDFVSIGIGGSYLGVQATIEAVKGSLSIINLLPRTKPRVFFLGNHMDPNYTVRVMEILQRSSSVGVNVISKSGGTVEPAIAFAIIERMMERKFPKNSAEKIIVTTDKDKGALKKLANEKGYKTYVVPDNVGGRYSVTCPVGLFGLAVAGIDLKEFIAGTRFAEEQTRNNPFEKNAALLRAVMRFIAYDSWQKKIEVAATGNFNLKMVTSWMQQLGPETEGKDGKGLWISPEFYTQDAYANGQMIQEGERNMIETFLMVEKPGDDLIITAKDTPVDYLDGQKLSFVNQAFVEGLRDAHYHGGVPCMSLILPKLDAFTIGQLYQLEMNTIALGGLLLGVNPFIQPGVQQYKAVANAKSGKPGTEKELAEMEKIEKALSQEFVV